MDIVIIIVIIIIPLLLATLTTLLTKKPDEEHKSILGDTFQLLMKRMGLIEKKSLHKDVDDVETKLLFSENSIEVPNLHYLFLHVCKAIGERYYDSSVVFYGPYQVKNGQSLYNHCKKKYEYVSPKKKERRKKKEFPLKEDTKLVSMSIRFRTEKDDQLSPAVMFIPKYMRTSSGPKLASWYIEFETEDDKIVQIDATKWINGSGISVRIFCNKNEYRKMIQDEYLDIATEKGKKVLKCGDGFTFKDLMDRLVMFVTDRDELCDECIMMDKMLGIYLLMEYSDGQKN